MGEVNSVSTVSDNYGDNSAALNDLNNNLTDLEAAIEAGDSSKVFKILTNIQTDWKQLENDPSFANNPDVKALASVLSSDFTNAYAEAQNGNLGPLTAEVCDLEGSFKSGDGYILANAILPVFLDIGNGSIT